MVRRTYKITAAQDAHITRLSGETGLDKEEVVQMGLEMGLPEVERLWKESGWNNKLDFVRAQLMRSREGSIKKTGAKRRA